MDSLCNKVPPPIQYNVIRYNSDNKPSHYYYFGDKMAKQKFHLLFFFFS